MDNIKQILPTIVNGFTENLLAWAVLLSAIATIVMTLVELLKGVFQLRLFYNFKLVRLWVKDKFAFKELLLLATGNTSFLSILFDQPTDKMMGQIQAAANVAIDFPDKFPNFYKFLTVIPSINKENESPTDNKSWDSYTDKEYRPKSDSEVWEDFSIKMTAENMESERNMPDSLVREATQARARIDHFTARKLDAFQTKSEYWWARFNQTVSIIGSGTFISILLVSIHANVYQIVFLSIFGGMISPFAKDVVSGLSGLSAKK